MNLYGSRVALEWPADGRGRPDVSWARGIAINEASVPARLGVSSARFWLVTPERGNNVGRLVGYRRGRSRSRRRDPGALRRRGSVPGASVRGAPGLAYRMRPEEHRDQQPCRPGGLHGHLQTGARRRPGQRGGLHLPQALCGRPAFAFGDGLTGLVDHPHRVRGGDLCPISSPCLVVSVSTGSPAGATLLSGRGPKETRPTDGSHSCAATGPGLKGPAHFPHPGHPWPGRVWQSDQRGQTLTGLSQSDS